MKPRIVLSKANDILQYLKRRRKKRLYKQWVEMAGLPAEAMPQEEVAGVKIPEIDKKQRHLTMLYILLGASITILCVGLIFLAVRS